MSNPEVYFISPEQERQKELFPKLFTIAQKFYSSSDNADESIYKEMKELKDNIENPEQYYFWSLLDPKISTNELDYDAIYDTKDNAIENFFLKLQEEMKTWKKMG